MFEIYYSVFMLSYEVGAIVAVVRLVAIFIVLHYSTRSEELRVLSW